MASRLLTALMLVWSIQVMATDTPPVQSGDADILARVRQSIARGDAAQFTQLKKQAEARGIVVELGGADLQEAIEGGSLPIFAYLFGTIGKDDRIFRVWSNLLLNGVESRRNDIVQFLLKPENAVDPYYLKKNSAEVMSVAIKNDDGAMVETLIEGGADFDQKRDKGWMTKMGVRYLWGSRELDVSNGFIEAIGADAVNVVSCILKRYSGLRYLGRGMYILSLQYYLEKDVIPSKRMIAAFFDAGVTYDDMHSLTSRSFVTKFFAKRGLHNENRDGESLLSMAISKDCEVMEYLLTERKVPLTKNLQEIACAGRDAVLLERLLRYQLKQDPGWTFASRGFWKNLETVTDTVESNRAAILKHLFSCSESDTAEKKKNHLDAIKVFVALAIPKNDSLALNTLLAVAVGQNNLEAAQYLLEMHADANVRMREESWALYAAVDIAFSSCMWRMAKLLLDHGASVPGMDPVYGRTAFHYIADCKGPEAVELIERVSSQAKTLDINAKNMWGDTALMDAVRKDNASAARALLQHGADVHMIEGTDFDMSYAIKHGSPELIRVLREGGAPVKRNDELMRAAVSNDLPAVKAMVTDKLSPEDCKGYLAAAIRGNAPDVLAWLKAHCVISGEDQRELFVSALIKDAIPLLDILKDWGRAALARGEGNDFLKPNEPFAGDRHWEANAWLFRNRFIIETTEFNEHVWHEWVSGLGDWRYDHSSRLINEKILKPGETVTCAQITRAFPLRPYTNYGHINFLTVLIETTDTDYVRSIISCYPKAQIQDQVVDSRLRKSAESLEPKTVRKILNLVADWHPYELKYEPRMKYYEDSPDELAKLKEIDEMLKKSGIKLVQ